MNVKIHRLAVAEIDREVDYYESRQPGLGSELESEIDAAFSVILRFPDAAPQWRDRPDRRVTSLDRFPFQNPLSDCGRRHRGARTCAHQPAAGLLVETPPLSLMTARASFLHVMHQPQRLAEAEPQKRGAAPKLGKTAV